MKRRIALGGLLIVGAFSIAVSGVQAPSPAAVDAAEIEHVKDNLYVITGSGVTDSETFSGGNTGVFITDDGVTIVDTKLAGWGQVILDRVRSVTDKPVTRIINTHTHYDHTGSNAELGAVDQIVAHANAKASMMQDSCEPVTNCEAFKGENAQYLPSHTYSDRLTLGTGTNQIDLYHFGAGHTNGDTFIVYPALRVLQTGDMFPWKGAPFLDRSNGGSGVAMPETLAGLLAGIENVETVIPGHIPVTTWSALEEFQRFTADLLQDVRAAIDAGQNVEEATASIDLSDRYPTYASDRVPAAIEAIYDELQPQ
jgi:cyclase